MSTFLWNFCTGSYLKLNLAISAFFLGRHGKGKRQFCRSQTTVAGQPTQGIGISFLKSYASVCMEGAIILLACVIFSIFAASPPVIDTAAAPVAMVWSYLGELIFNMLILVGTIKMADHVVKEMMGL